MTLPRNLLLDKLDAALRQRYASTANGLDAPPSAPDPLARPDRDHERRVVPDPDFVADQEWPRHQEAWRRVTSASSR